MNMSSGGGSGYSAEINITPLVDVVLVLLIIFMLIVPVMMRGYDMDIPGEQVAPAAAVERPEQMVLTIEPSACPVLEPPAAPGPPPDCAVNLNGESLAVANLPGRLRQIFEARGPGERVLFLTAHEKLNYEGVMRILDLARSEVEGLRVGLVSAPS